MKEILYCKKCHNKKRSISYDMATQKIESETNFVVVDRCLSTCGISKEKFFAEIDEELITGNSLEEVIEQIKE